MGRIVLLVDATRCGSPELVIGELRRAGARGVIVRRSRNRLEIASVIPPSKPPVLSSCASWRLVDEDEIKGGIEDFKSLLLEERFFEAHVLSETIIPSLPRLGRCLALYSALLVKNAEGLPRGARHLLRELENGRCRGIVLLDCARLLAEKTEYGVRVGGESVSCLGPGIYATAV